MSTIVDIIEFRSLLETMKPFPMSAYDKHLVIRAKLAIEEFPNDASLERQQVDRLIDRFIELASTKPTPEASDERD